MTAPAPRIVAAARGLLEAIVIAALGGVVVWLGEVDAGELAPFLPGALFVVRWLEGLADERIDPAKPRRRVGRALAGTTARR